MRNLRADEERVSGRVCAVRSVVLCLYFRELCEVLLGKCPEGFLPGSEGVSVGCAVRYVGSGSVCNVVGVGGVL